MLIIIQSEMATIYVNPLRGLDSENCHTNASIDNSCATLKYALSTYLTSVWPPGHTKYVVVNFKWLYSYWDDQAIVLN